MRILLVEDEAKVRGFLINAFESEGYATLSFSTFKDAKDHLESDEPSMDLAILDRQLGAFDGAQLIPIIKKKHPQTKILILSAMSDPDERAKALDNGADDYQGKPYSLTELLARSRALMRRSSPHSENTPRTKIQLGNLEVDLLGHEAAVSGQALDLTSKEFKLLSVLAEEPGRVWSKFRLLDLIWQINVELESNVVEVTVRNVRRKLEALNCSATIESKRNVGYWLEA